MDGRRHRRRTDNMKTVYPPQTKFARGIKKKIANHHMTRLNPNWCYNEVCYKGTALIIEALDSQLLFLLCCIVIHICSHIIAAICVFYYFIGFYLILHFACRLLFLLMFLLLFSLFSTRSHNFYQILCNWSTLHIWHGYFQSYLHLGL